MDPVVQGPFMLARDRTDINWTERGLMQAVIRPDDLPQVRRRAAELAEAALDAATGKGQIETVSRLGRFIPAKICGEYFGFPGPDVATMLRWSYAFQADMFKNLANDPATHAASVQAGDEMRIYLAELLAEKRAELKQHRTAKHEGLLDRVASFATQCNVFDDIRDHLRDLVHPQETTEDDIVDDTILERLLDLTASPTFRFLDDRVLANVAGFLIGSVETTSQAIVQVIEQLLQHPAELVPARQAAESGDDGTFDKYVFEALRFNPINPLVFRACEHDYVLARGSTRETAIPSGTVVFACTASGMFDEGSVHDPTSFSVDRPEHVYLHFGHGHHRCLGEPVASAVIPEVVKRVILRPGVHLLAGEAGSIDFQGGPFPERFTIGL